MRSAFADRNWAMMERFNNACSSIETDLARAAKRYLPVTACEAVTRAASFCAIEAEFRVCYPGLLAWDRLAFHISKPRARLSHVRSTDVRRGLARCWGSTR